MSLPKTDGFSILELLLVLALAGIIVGATMQLNINQPNKTLGKFEENIRSFLGKQQIAALNLAAGVRISASTGNRTLVSSTGDMLEVPNNIELKLHSDFDDPNLGAIILFLPNAAIVEGVIELHMGDVLVNIVTSTVNSK